MKRILMWGAGKLARFIQRIKDKQYYRCGKWLARYYRLLLAECGTHFQINGKASIGDPHMVHIGNHVTLNNLVQICPRAEVYIGDYVTMSRGAQITAGTLDLQQWSNERYKLHIHTQAPVHIGEGAWLCVNSIVLPGVSITGKGVVVAAGAVVTNDITEDYCVVGGVPAKIIRFLDEDERGKINETVE